MASQELRLAVIGDPVAHSKSPQLQTALIARYGRSGTYTALRVPLSETALQLRSLHAQGYHGLNVTTPLKEAVVAELVSADDIVRRIGAANTLIATPAGWHGANTDGIGARVAVSRAFTNLGLAAESSLRGTTILILGVGPTARAAAVALQSAGAAVVLWNRTPERAAALAADLRLEVWRSDITIEAAYATLPPDPQLPPEILSMLSSVPICLDANYGPRATLQRTLKRPVQNGEAMLAAQAEASLLRWLEVFP